PRAAASLAPVQEELATIVAPLEAGAYAKEARSSLAEVGAALAELAYDPAAHHAASEQAAALAPFEAEARVLADAQTRWQEEAALLEKALEAVQRWTAEARRLHERLALLEASIADLPDLRRSVESGLAVVATLQEQRGNTEQLLGAAKQRLDNLAALERKLAQSRTALRTLQDEQGLYEDLARAFGPNGVPALLIEQAIPTLQDTANELLARMSDSRLSINLIMQRPTQRGGTSETLDIRVADEQGTRKYETYSGGEAFRINFALRIALSRLLARRAGAALPTLFIDEGFGTQDTEGRDRVVEAINAVLDDFQRILVITHIDELKEAFPVRIEVTKTPGGSVIQVV
ncbi:MAG: SMC family ATPase, partial [Chloroflexi bacterium]|nr:SMC family ATPase [Chloroflexota bacterium]